MRKALLVFGVLLLMAGPVFSVSAQQEKQPAPDNTKTNQGDTNKNATTADQQKMNPADRETTKKIRSALVGDKSLSTYAHNVKIITTDRMVTLKGPVVPKTNNQQSKRRRDKLPAIRTSRTI